MLKKMIDYENKNQPERHQMRQKEWKETVAELLNKHPDKIDTHADSQKRIQNMKSLLSHSATGRMLLGWADENGVEIWMDHQADGYYGCIYPDSNTVILNARYSDFILSSTLGHEIQHLYQDSLDILPCVIEDIETYVVMRLLAEAGAYAVQGQIISELRDTNSDIFTNRHLWNRTRCATSIKDWQERNDLKASVFTNFLSSRATSYFIKSITESAIDQILGQPPRTPVKSEYIKPGLKFEFNHKSAPPAATLSARTIGPFGALPDGSNFLRGKLCMPGLQYDFAHLFTPIERQISDLALRREVIELKKARINP